MIGSYNGSALSQSDIQSPTQTILFFEVLGSARALVVALPCEPLAPRQATDRRRSKILS